MTREEFREHRRMLRARSRMNESSPKRRRNREKNAARQRERRFSRKQLEREQRSAKHIPSSVNHNLEQPSRSVSNQEQLPSSAFNQQKSPSSVVNDKQKGVSAASSEEYLQASSTRLTKADYNFLSRMRQKIIKQALTPSRFAHMIKSIVTNTHSSRKKAALRQLGLSFDGSTGKLADVQASSLEL